MTDRTTAGTEVEQDEVEALLHNLCGFHLAERDPASRYAVLTREQVLFEALAAAIRRERGRALAELVERGHKLTEVAELTGLRSRQQVQRLIHIGAVPDTAPEAATGAQAVADASRQFEERLAAVEATLDLVVSGVPTVNEPGVPAQLTTDYETVPDREPYLVTFDDDGEPSIHRVPTGAYPTVTPSAPVRQPAGETFDPLTADISELTGVLEPTQVMPALSAALSPTKEFSGEDDWYRRTGETGAA